MSEFRTSCPLLSESDIISLSDGFLCRITRKNAKLSDVALGAEHTLLRPAIAEGLSRPVRYADLAAETASKGVKTEELVETLGFLNRIGALRVRRTAAASLGVLRLRLRDFVLGVAHPSVTWRAPYTVPNLAVGLWRASWPVVVLMPLALAPFAFIGVVTLPRAIGLGLVFDAAFVGSMLVHELAHAVIIRRHTKHLVIMQTGMRFGLVHRALPRRAEAASALAGPCAGLLSAGLAGIIMAVAAHEFAFALMAYMAAVSHLASLLPAYSDGAALVTALRFGKSPKANT